MVRAFFIMHHLRADACFPGSFISGTGQWVVPCDTEETMAFNFGYVAL